MNQLFSTAIADTWRPTVAQSREVVNAITTGRDLSAINLPNIVERKIPGLRKRYEKIVSEIGQDYKPRNLPLYLLIRKNYPNFNWVETEHQVHIETYFSGTKHCLLSYLLGLVPADKISNSARNSRLIMKSSHTHTMQHCLSVFAQQGVCSLSNDNFVRLHKWIDKGRAGESVTIVSPVCPDYSAVAGEDKRFRFTFESLGIGIGLSGMRIFESLPALRNLFEVEFGIKNLVHHLCVGDFEAFSSENTKRLKISKDTFLDQNRQSSIALEESAPNPIISSLFTDHCGGEHGWQKEYDEMRLRFERGDFGCLETSKLILEIAKAREPLYKRWSNLNNISNSDLVHRVIEQGIEYATMGKIISQNFKNPLVLGADHVRMAPFYQFTSDFPVIYLDRNYE